MNLVISAPEEVIAPAQLVMRLPPDVTMSADQFFEFCQHNRDLRIERSKNGEIIILAPASGETERLPAATQVSGDPLLPRFVLPLKEIWEPDF